MACSRHGPKDGCNIPNLPQSLDTPRQPLEQDTQISWLEGFYRMLQQQWTRMVQVLNAVWKIDTAANKPTTPLLDEAAFYESDTGRVFLASAGLWVLLNGFTGQTVTVNAGYTMTTASVVLANATSGALVVTLNQGTTYQGRIRVVKKTDATGNAVTISPSSGSIEGIGTRVLSVQYASVILTSDGTDMYVLGQV